MTTEGFLKHLEENLELGGQEIDLKAWIYSPGLPANCPIVETDELLKVAKAANAFLAGRSPAEISTEFETKNWTTHHWNHFLRSFGTKLTTEQMKQLDDKFKFTQSGNSEITHDWLMLVVESEYGPGMSRLEEFLTSQGRRKFLKPLYEKLASTEQGKVMAKQIYAKARSGYHAVSRQTIDEILGHEEK